VHGDSIAPRSSAHQALEHADRAVARNHLKSAGLLEPKRSASQIVTMLSTTRIGKTKR